MLGSEIGAEYKGQVATSDDLNTAINLRNIVSSTEISGCEHFVRSDNTIQPVAAQLGGWKSAFSNEAVVWIQENVTDGLLAMKNACVSSVCIFVHASHSFEVPSLKGKVA